MKVAVGLVAVLTHCLALSAPITGQGTWETTLQARDWNRDGTVDGYYDTVQDITWSADANILSGVVPTDPSIDGPYVGDGAAWFIKRYVPGVQIAGIGGWRLPRATGKGLIDLVATFEPDLRPEICIPASACNWLMTEGDGEFAHLVLSTLGNTGNPPLAAANTGHFRNVQSVYAADNTFSDPSGTVSHGDGSFFYMSVNGAMSISLQPSSTYAWVVRDGDIAVPVPEPSTWALLLGGLAVVATAAGRRKGSTPH